MLFNLNLERNDRVVFVGNEETDFFTRKRVYNVVDIIEIKGKTHIVLIDDADEENCITIPFYNKNFKKIEVIIQHSLMDGTLVISTENDIIEFVYDLKSLWQIKTLLNSLNIGYEIINDSYEIEE